MTAMVMNNIHGYPELNLVVEPDSLPLFTTVFQSGIEVETEKAQTVGQFLSRFPGFTADYLANTVQTIFLDGTPLDDLTTVFHGERPVLALSAAMPGLAGAIFRRNSFHAALRSVTDKAEASWVSPEKITVTLKLFNAIARERGPRLLRDGVHLNGSGFAGFLKGREYLQRSIQAATMDGSPVEPAAVQKKCNSLEKLFLTILTTDE